MALGLHGAISWFQSKIGTYDKENWEITVEKQEIPISKLATEELSVANVRSDLLDIDLIRGSTFTKAKPSYHWTQVTRKGFLRVILFPVYYQWWRQQTSFRVWLFFVSLYFLQLVALVIYATHQTDEEFKFISWPEAFVPAFAMVLLGEMYIHVVSTNFTKPLGHKIKKQKSKDKRQSRRKRHVRRQSLTSRQEDSMDSLVSRDTSVDRGSPEEPYEHVVASQDASSASVTAVRTALSCDLNKNGLRHRFLQKDKKETTDEDEDGSRFAQEKNSSNQNLSAGSPVASGSDSESGGSSSTTALTDNEGRQEENPASVEEIPFMFMRGSLNNVKNAQSFYLRGADETVTVSLWDGASFKKAKLTFLEIGMAVVDKVESQSGKTSDYLGFAVFSAILIGILPMIFRLYQAHVVVAQFQTYDGVKKVLRQLFGSKWEAQLIVVIAMISRVALSFAMFFLLCVADASYMLRYRYAKYFGALTSTRRARRNGLPHFRLHKVKNIKAWISLRSFLKKRGPQRSVDTIISMAFVFGILLLVFTCIQFISLSPSTKDSDKENFLAFFCNWELSAWCIVLGIFLIRFISLGSEINRKYRNNSVLLTEQINLYLQMTNSPNKKEELIIANNVLKLATKLLKELEGPFKVSGMIMNPLLSNIIRVVVLSLFSGVMSDILGFRLRLWKIKA